MFKKCLTIIFSLFLVGLISCSDNSNNNNIKEPSTESLNSTEDLQSLANENEIAVSKDEIIPQELIGEFVSEKDVLFVFSEDGVYGYYKSSADRNDNYYAGTMKVEPWNNNMLLNLDGSPSNYYAKLSKEGQAYSVELYFDELHSEGIDKSSSLDPNAYYWFLWVVIDDKNAKVVNIETDTTLQLQRIK